MSYYPPYVYSPREDVTLRNMRDYNRKQAAIEKKCLEIDPNYYHKNLRERRQIRNRVEEDLEW